MIINRFTNWLLTLNLILIIGMGCMCDHPNTNFDTGVYQRIYGRDANIYELVDIRDESIFIQKFYEGGKLRFSNTGEWVYVSSNQNHSPKWPNGRSIVLLSEWISAEELLRLERLGESPDSAALRKDTVAAIVRDRQRFAFDEDGGSDYKRMR